MRVLALAALCFSLLGVVSGWYSTKVSGTFVSGPHDSEADCLRRINEIDPPLVKKKR